MSGPLKVRLSKINVLIYHSKPNYVETHFSEEETKVPSN